MSLSTTARLIFFGCYESAGTADPRLSRADRLALAKGLSEPRSYLGRFPDPRHLVIALDAKIGVATVPTPCGTAASPSMVLYTWHPDREVWGLRVYHGLACMLLLRSAIEYTEADAWLLTGELAAPLDLARVVGVPEIVRTQRYVPSWFVRAWVEGRPARHLVRDRKGSGARKIQTTDF